MKAIEILKSLAPTLATALGGPLGGAAVKFAVDKLMPGTEVENEQQGMDLLEQFINGANPERMAQLKALDNEFKLEMRRLDFRDAELNVQDRNSARQLATARGMAPQLILSVVYTIAYGVVLYCFMAGRIMVPDAQQILFGSLIGILTAAQVQILNFWFGSSSGSKGKDIKNASV